MNEIQLTVTVGEANLILEAVGQLPFARVYTLVTKLQEQARTQLDASQPAAEDAADQQSPAAPGEEDSDGN